MRNIALIGSLLIIPACTIAQQDTTGGMRLGIKVSPNLGWLSSDDKEIAGDGSRIGFTWGLVADLPLGGHGAYALQTGLLQSSIGGKFKVAYTADGSTVSSSYDLALSYLEVPLALKMRTTNAGPLNFYGLLGMGAALNLKARADISNTTIVAGVPTITTLDKENVTDQFAAFKLDLMVGAGTEMKVSSITLFGGLTYNKGLINVLDKDSKKVVDDGEKKKMLADYLELTLGLYF